MERAAENSVTSDTILHTHQLTSSVVTKSHITIDDISTWDELSKYITAFCPAAKGLDGRKVTINVNCWICCGGLDLPSWVSPDGARDEEHNIPAKNEKLAVLPCGHFFGAECLRIWCKKSMESGKTPVCPLCRVGLTHHMCDHLLSFRTLNSRRMNTFYDIVKKVPNTKVHFLAPVKPLDSVHTKGIDNASKGYDSYLTTLGPNHYASAERTHDAEHGFIHHHDYPSTAELIDHVQHITTNSKDRPPSPNHDHCVATHPIYHGEDVSIEFVDVTEQWVPLNAPHRTTEASGMDPLCIRCRFREAELIAKVSGYDQDQVNALIDAERAVW
ncbi:hypothetical protein GGR57DRAFT_451972 [Xylariaceae sp. FL1272]|nr:hypothetical protein GGR57DRAFT_451972 [Xylariaceae sp. FL1272]